MVEIILGNGEVSSHFHENESFSMLVDGKASIEFNGQTHEMERGYKYIIPPYTLHTMKNLANDIVKIQCGGH